MLHVSNSESACNILTDLKNQIYEHLQPTSTSCGANKVASLTADGIVSSMLNAGKLDTTLTSGITLYRLQTGNNGTCIITQQTTANTIQLTHTTVNDNYIVYTEQYEINHQLQNNISLP